MARIYQPKGPGPFPIVLDLHGGAWNAKDRFAEEPMDRALAASGLLVVAIDMTLAPEAPYLRFQDANFAVRWLKAKGASWRGDTSKVGVYGSSSGGHVAELLGMRPRDPRYNAHPLPEAANVDATIAYAAMRSPVSNPVARFQNAETLKRDAMVKNHTTFFKPWETIHEQPAGNPGAARTGEPRSAADHAGRTRRQRAPGGSGTVRRDVQEGGRLLRISRVRRLRARMGRQARAADGSRPRDGESVHRAPGERLIMRTWAATALACALFLVAVVSAENGAVSATACENLARSLSLPDAAVTLSEAVGAGKFAAPGGGAAAAKGAAALPAFCRVTLKITPSADSDIRSEVWLPMAGWNGKFLQVGNGAWGGSVQYGPLGDALRRGYAAASTDTGHTGADASFAMGHPEKLIDFGYRSVHETAVQGKATVAALYGEKPRVSYFNGCSGGGRMSFMEAQRFPGDFDGIIAGAPGYNRTDVAFSDARHGAGNTRDPGELHSGRQVPKCSTRRRSTRAMRSTG